MLGQLYYPMRRAKETAQIVLEEGRPMACNVAWGCLNSCSYCYVPFIKKGQIRFPKKLPKDLVWEQLCKGVRPDGVFLCFATDPFITCNQNNSDDVVKILLEKGIKVATLSKIGFTHPNSIWQVRNGMTIVSDKEEFRKKFEPNTVPIIVRLKALREIHDNGGYTWISLEPFVTPNIFEQSLVSLLDKIDFVDFIIFGKLNYDKRANNKEFYRKMVKIFEKYCREQGIRHFVKSDTREFIKDDVKTESKEEIKNWKKI